MKEKIREIINPVLQQQTLFQLSQVKKFVDVSLREATSKNFENESDKIKYLLDTLYNIRDFVLAQTTENSVRISLINQFKKIEEEEIMGNLQKQQEEKLSLQTEEKSEQDQKGLEEERGIEVENTANG